MLGLDRAFPSLLLVLCPGLLDETLLDSKGHQQKIAGSFTSQHYKFPEDVHGKAALGPTTFRMGREYCYES